uniref:Uncharacterized protein n=1 Tax=Ascaris lumbricoides TaxID=6252 RepID=A0A0M3HYI8_ASCLU
MVVCWFRKKPSPGPLRYQTERHEDLFHRFHLNSFEVRCPFHLFSCSTFSTLSHWEVTQSLVAVYDGSCSWPVLNDRFLLMAASNAAQYLLIPHCAFVISMTHLSLLGLLIVCNTLSMPSIMLPPFLLRISLDDIAQLKFPPGAMRHSATLTSPNSPHTTLHCHFEPARTQILHIPMNNIRSQKDAIRLKAVNELCGTVFITQNEAIEAATEANASTGNVQNGCDEDVTCESSFEIHSIRKKPKLPLEGVRERVKAFGVVSKKKRDKLPNLISNN